MSIDDPGGGAGAPPAAVSVEEFRREVADKLGVVFHGCVSSPLERATHRQQCEDFLVELYQRAAGGSPVPSRPQPEEWPVDPLDPCEGHPIYPTVKAVPASLSSRDAIGPYFLRDLCRTLHLPDDADLDVIAQAIDRLQAAARPGEDDDGGVAETERLHAAECRAQDARSHREAQILQAGFDLGQMARPGEEPPDAEEPEHENDTREARPADPPTSEGRGVARGLADHQRGTGDADARPTDAGAQDQQGSRPPAEVGARPDAAPALAREVQQLKVFVGFLTGEEIDLDRREEIWRRLGDLEVMLAAASESESRGTAASSQAGKASVADPQMPRPQVEPRTDAAPATPAAELNCQALAAQLAVAQAERDQLQRQLNAERLEVIEAIARKERAQREESAHRERAEQAEAGAAALAARVQALARQLKDEIVTQLEWIQRESYVVDLAKQMADRSGLATVVDHNTAMHALLFIRKVLREEAALAAAGS